MPKNMMTEYVLQMSKKRGYGDLKKRVADCLSAMHGTEIKESEIRMWKTTDKLDTLIESCEKFTNKSDVEANDTTEPDPDLEVNSGVQFPGESVEPLINVATNLEDDTFDESGLVVEYKLNPESEFAFSFQKN
jgi:hypothetical protein